MGGIGETKEQLVNGWKRSQGQRKQAEEVPRGFKRTLSALMERIIDSDYDSVEELVTGSDIYSIGKIRAFLNEIIATWRENEITPAAMYALLKFVYLYLEQPRIQISFKNRPPVPICYFSSYLLPSASLLHSYLKTRSIAGVFFKLDETDQHLIKFIDDERPPAVLFSLLHFLHVHPLRQLVPHLQDRNLKVFIGGIPFVYEESLKREFSGCIFPRDLTELTLLLENSLEKE